MRLLTSLHQNKIHYKNYLLLLVICLLAYWPLSFGLFSVKNDAIHYFLPYRFNISETLRNGEWPFWSPYIYLGNPVYGDMQSGAWNPIVWFFSFLGRYDLTSFHYETLLYIFLGAVGMYKLTNRLAGHSQTALLISVSYMLSGFMLSGQLINWLAAAAFLPFVLHYYLQTIRSASLGNAVKTGGALFFLLTAGYPSFFIITGYILLLLFLIAVISRSSNKEAPAVSWRRFFIQQLIVIAVFTGLALPAIISFIELLPYYQRGGGTAHLDSIQNSFEWQHLLSLFFPSSIKASDIVSATDVTCRNVYQGIFSVLILAVFPPKLNRRNILLILLAVLALLFSLGDASPVQKFCYNIIPLMNTFRHPSQMRLFFLLALLLLAVPGLKKFLDKGLSIQDVKKVKAVTWTMAVAILLITILAFVSSGFLKQWSGLRLSGIRENIKALIENISLADTVFINGLIQLFFISLFLLWIKKYTRHRHIFSFLWIGNLFIMAQLVLPVTFVSKTSPKEINALIHASPKGFPVNGLERPIEENSKDAFDNFDKIALAYFYNKKTGVSRISNSPSFLQEQEQFLNSNLLYHYVSSKPTVYLADSVLKINDTLLLNPLAVCSYVIADDAPAIKGICSAGNKVIIKKISANRFEIATQTVSASFLVLTQSYHHHWKVWVDGRQGSIYKVNTSFMGTLLPQGNHNIVFRFVPSNTLKAIWIMFTTLIVLIIIAAVSLIHKIFPGPQQ